MTMGKLTTHLQERVTWGYNDGWQHLDKWGEGINVHILSTSKRIYDPNDMYGECWTRFIRIKAPYGVLHDTVYHILICNFRQNCRCEHDCCGHVSSWPMSAKRLRRREWLVEVGYRVNC